MAGNSYKLKFYLNNGTTQGDEFTAPQGDQSTDGISAYQTATGEDS